MALVQRCGRIDGPLKSDIAISITHFGRCDSQILSDAPAFFSLGSWSASCVVWQCVVWQANGDTLKCLLTRKSRQGLECKQLSYLRVL
eukprot:SAG11_NODE_558_length_8540_cov_3.877147_1_plen_88_part_00